MKTLRCSFCGRRESEVRRLIAGNDALICDQCIAKAARAMQRDAGERVTPLDEKTDE